MSEVLSDREAVIFYAEQRGYASAMEAERKLHEARIETQAVEIERLLGDLERVLSVAKEIEKACRGLRDEAQPMTAKDAARLIIAELTGAKP